MRVPALVYALVMGTLLGACTEEENPGRGGIRTAQLRGESFVVDGKLAECTDSAALTDVWQRIFQAADSLPLTDGGDAKWVVELTGVLSGMLSATTCAELYQALNFGVAPPPCEDESRACVGDVAQECRTMGASKLRFDTDCARTGMKCREGRCILGTCVSDACDGDSLVTCTDGVKSLFLCGVLGLTCGNGSNGLACVGKGDVCSTSDPDYPVVPKCEGSILSWCLGGKLATVDCGLLTDGRRTCNWGWLDTHTDVTSDEILDKHFTDACGPTGGDCEGNVSECEGSSLKLCIDGYYEYEVCRDYHATGCSTDGVFGQYATCVGFPAAAD
jgi:hypothetical protein